jgi:hypothetical protein
MILIRGPVANCVGLKPAPSNRDPGVLVTYWFTFNKIESWHLFSNRTTLVTRYPFGRVFLLKSPRFLKQSTRHPTECKSNYKSIHFLLDSTQTFLKILAVIHWCHLIVQLNEEIDFYYQGNSKT